MKKVFSLIDLRDVQLCLGMAMLWYGLFLYSLPISLVVVGSLIIAPIILPSIRGGK